ncbi:ferric reductase-like transmembrane domain-containing protein [Flammeovirga yaeyamensis]|uniref:Ferric reductase-like transmembrane domain-containing protein n=1 Tax=Flammeovirga yaeyamensis TaxID=367791 RepID=A0AAX1N5I4_9BACT|nr:ferric reductase-like transmembrane domain-containing protein [Flammeovirga yaeyamensis]MBB3701165.1 sulfoxide reductase heme-binding subunit YedZ [Flammeovirga yaeyamensis]NMF38368.1 ferric reductase [Flammeovirga yaeyamensis]QWG01631.1 ferric reductase-like transmembrane domain-containing protein [Flammeovirga yaeyamensis]
MAFIKRNYGWIIVTILTALPLIVLTKMIQVDWSDGFTLSLVESMGKGDRTTLDMLYHVTGEFAIRWLTAVLTCTPFFILFGVNNLFVRQAMGIAAAVWSILHFIIFIWMEGFMETFTQVNYVAGFIAVLTLIPLLLTSNRKSMKRLKKKWKKLQKYAYVAVILSLLHVALLEKTWIIYAVVVGIGFIIRIPDVKEHIIAFRLKRKK